MNKRGEREREEERGPDLVEESFNVRKQNKLTRVGEGMGG